MKNLFGCLLAAALMVSGCTVTKNPNPPTQEQRVDRLALVLKTTVASVVTLAAEDRTPETRERITKARDLMNAVVEAGGATPQEIVKSLAPLWQDAKPEVRIAANAALGLLQAYFDEYVFEVPEGSVNAQKFLKAVVAGIDEGLAMSPPVGH